MAMHAGTASRGVGAGRAQRRGRRRAFRLGARAIVIRWPRRGRRSRQRCVASRTTLVRAARTGARLRPAAAATPTCCRRRPPGSAASRAAAPTASARVVPSAQVAGDEVRSRRLARTRPRGLTSCASLTSRLRGPRSTASSRRSPTAAQSDAHGHQRGDEDAARCPGTRRAGGRRAPPRSAGARVPGTHRGDGEGHALEGGSRGEARVLGLRRARTGRGSRELRTAASGRAARSATALRRETSARMASLVPGSVDQGVAHAGRGGDVADRRPPDALVGEQPGGGVEDERRGLFVTAAARRWSRPAAPVRRTLWPCTVRRRDGPPAVAHSDRRRCA